MMQEWISENWLALYGAIVGTLAIVINLSRLIHIIKKDRVKLAVSFAPHPQQAQNIKLLKATEKNDPGDELDLVKVYQLTIRNNGSVDAYIEDAGIICKKGLLHSVLISGTGNSLILRSIPNVESVKISPKASKKMNVYLKRDEDIFFAKKAFIIDSTGKEWSAKAKKLHKVC